MSVGQTLGGHDVARRVRGQGGAALVRLPRADALIWSATILLTVIGGGGTALAVWWSRMPQPEPAVVEMRVGDERLAVPSDYLGPRRADAGREVGMVRLRVTWPEFKPPASGDRAEVHVTIRPAGPEGAGKPAFATFARFLQPGAWSNPGGLVARNFKKGSPFEADELYLSLPDGDEFLARCTADVGPSRLDEGCRAVLRHGPFDLALRFPREALTEWRALVDGARALVDGLRRSPPGRT